MWFIFRLLCSSYYCFLDAVPSGSSDAHDPTSCLDRVLHATELIGKAFREGSLLFPVPLPDKAGVDRIVLERLLGLLREASDKHSAMLGSADRGGAKTGLCLMMAYHAEIKIEEVTKGLPDRYDDDKSIDQDEVLESVAGYATRVASMVNMKVYYKEHALPSNLNGDLSNDKDSDVDGSEEMDDGSHGEGGSGGHISSESLQDLEEKSTVDGIV